MIAAGFPSLLQGFFTERLLRQRQASSHTIAGYRDTFRLLLRFAADQLGKAPSTLKTEDFQPAFVGRFLEHLEHVPNRPTRQANAGSKGSRGRRSDTISVNAASARKRNSPASTRATTSCIIAHATRRTLSVGAQPLRSAVPGTNPPYSLKPQSCY